jgi:lipopolysaccharide export system permease protein
MLTILDRYIARQYLINVAALLVILFSFVVTIDVSLNFDRFVNLAERWLRDGDPAGQPDALRKGLTVVFLIVDLWWPRLLQLFNFLLGVVLLGAMGFTCSQLVRHRELVAVLASGQSLYRVARPILLVALALTGLQVLNQELVIPRIAPLLTRDHGDAGKRGLGLNHIKLIRDSKDRLLCARVFDADKGTLGDVSIIERDAQGLATAVISAKAARWRDGGWDLEEGKREIRQGAFRPPSPVARVETNLNPEALRMQRYTGYSQSLSWAQIAAMLTRDQALDSRTSELLTRVGFGRVSIMLANILALVIAMPFFLRREPANMMLQSLKAAPWAVSSLIGGVVGASVAIPGVPAALGAFIPVMILLPIAIASVTAVRT